MRHRAAEGERWPAMAAATSNAAASPPPSRTACWASRCPDAHSARGMTRCPPSVGRSSPLIAAKPPPESTWIPGFQGTRGPTLPPAFDEAATQGTPGAGSGGTPGAAPGPASGVRSWNPLKRPMRPNASSRISSGLSTRPASSGTWKGTWRPSGNWPWVTPRMSEHAHGAPEVSPLEVSSSLISPLARKTVRSQMLVTRSAMRSRLWATHKR